MGRLPLPSRQARRSGAPFQVRQRVLRSVARHGRTFEALPTGSAPLDGELCFVGAEGLPRVYHLMRTMRLHRPDETALMFFAFDLLHQDGVDLQHLPLSASASAISTVCATNARTGGPRRYVQQRVDSTIRAKERVKRQPGCSVTWLGQMLGAALVGGAIAATRAHGYSGLRAVAHAQGNVRCMPGEGGGCGGGNLRATTKSAAK